MLRVEPLFIERVEVDDIDNSQERSFWSKHSSTEAADTKRLAHVAYHRPAQIDYLSTDSLLEGNNHILLLV